MIKEDPTATWDDIIIWTMDLAGAYTLLSFRPENANLMAMAISNNRIFIFWLDMHTSSFPSRNQGADT